VRARHAILKRLLFPSFEEGWLRPINKMSRYLRQGAAGEVSRTSQIASSDLPGRADSKVARARGVTTIYFLVFILGISGLLAMATDFGRFYLIQAELQTAADAAALAAATKLIGTVNAPDKASDQVTTSFDSTTGNDNRFNLRMNPIGVNAGTDLATTSESDYFSTLVDAQTNANGGQTGGIDWSSGFYPKYVRVQITAQAPVLFVPLLNRAASRPTIAVSAVAGLSGPICSACGIDGLAVVDQSAGSDALDYGFVRGSFYTLYLVRSQRTAGAVTPAALAGTNSAAAYVILNHIPSGPADLDVDGSLFEFGASGLSTSAGSTIPTTVSIDGTEAAYSTDGSTTAGQDILCGLNARFGADPSQNNCVSIGGGQFTNLAPLFSADTDLGEAAYAAGAGLQDFAMEYDGNLRRVLTVAIVDAADSLNVLNFRQFLIEMSPVSPTVTQGLNTTLVTGAFRAQYIGALVPLRCGGIGGLCRVSSGVGRTVLH
jgi:Flp pilus assembly protein TadG